MATVDRTCNVYWSYVEATIPEGKRKLVVPVLPTNDSWYCFLINSKLVSRLEKNPKLRDCCVEIPQATHPFLDHDSFLNAAERPFVLPDHDLESAGRLNTTCQRFLYDAIRKNPVIRSRLKGMILEHLEGY